MKRGLILILLTLCALYIFATQGALPGEFSVSASLKVHFSQGNLQYQASTGTWRFAGNQYSYIGTANSNISSSYSGWIDLFGWGTSGANQKPYETSEDYHIYPGNGGSLSNSIDGSNYDWGKYNKISNGGNQTGKWRTLTSAEWKYLLSTRSGAANKFGFAKVNGIAGLVLLPDNWQLPSGCSFTAGNRPINWTTNTYTTAQWSTMENAGAVFFPITGKRAGTSVSSTGATSGVGHYWMSTVSDGSNYWLYAWHLSFYANETDGYWATRLESSSGVSILEIKRYHGAAVRLVQNSSVYNSTTYTLTVNSSNTSYGTVSGGGIYGLGASVTITATPKTGYQFVQWQDGNTNASRSITISGNATYTATFAPITYTITWKQDDGSTINQTSVEYGKTPTHADPSKTDAWGCTYIFAGWIPAITTVTGNATYTALFTTPKYTIKTETDNASQGSATVSK